MGVLKDVVELSISDEDIKEWQLEQAQAGIISKRIKDKIGEAFIPVENRDLTCHWLCMNANDFSIMRKYSREIFEPFHSAEVLKSCRFGHYFTAIVVVNRNIDEPVGYAKDELPEGLVKDLPDGVGLG